MVQSIEPPLHPKVAPEAERQDEQGYENEPPHGSGTPERHWGARLRQCIALVNGAVLYGHALFLELLEASARVVVVSLFYCRLE
jgi:hypothetical protein